MFILSATVLVHLVKSSGRMDLHLGAAFLKQSVHKSKFLF
jgi:hypothetical protein